MVHSESRPKQSKNLDNSGLSDNSFLNMLKGITKRAFDFIAALIGLSLLSPFFALIAILIKRDSSGPVFYWGLRIGRHGVTFKMLKFRTMYETPKSYRGPRVTCSEDDRITPFGKWLRDTKLNELPQLWNVLIGEMSLVGPRPEDPTISKTWPTLIAREILSVRPGITSPASVVYRDEESMLHAGEVMRKYLHELSPNKMRLDQLYVRYRSFWLDLDVILWTALIILPKIKSYPPPEKLLFAGPVARLIQRYVSWFIWDFLVVLASISITGAFVRLFGPLNIGWLKAAAMALGCSMLYSLVGLFLNTNRINWPKASSWEAGRLWASWMVSTTVILCFHFYLGVTSLRIYGLLIGASILSLFGIIIIRYRGRLISGLLSRLLTHRLRTHETRERVLIVGSGRTAEHISWLMDHPTYSGKFQIVGFIDDDLMSQGMKIYGSKVIGKVDEIHRIVKKRDIGLIILADNQIASDRYKEFHNTSSFSPARIVVAPDIFGSLSGLDSGSTNSEANDNLNDFQCQHCLARYTSRQVQSRSIRSYEFKATPLMKRIPQEEDGKNWKISG
jgi:lipopolysaccharide/colanic/teichoic acid biosynthesis glycosyltransferase